MIHIKQTKYELQNLVSGESSTSYDASIQTIASYLGRSQKTSPMDKEKFKNKPKEKEKLIRFASLYNLWITDIDENHFVSSGAEQKVYINGNGKVLKLNDAIYYASWLDYFYNLLLHNYFFSDTAYSLKGFYKSDQILYAVVEQPFIRANKTTNLDKVKDFMIENGFKNTKNHDYIHSQLGIIVEDLHDENVLTNDSHLYFIDTVFFIDPSIFWNSLD